MPERILLVEDEAHIAQGLKLNLESEGFAVCIADDGRKAIERILRDEPDLVVLDVELPGLSGFEVCDRVRHDGSRVPILFLTVRDSEDDRIRGLELGGDDYMTKPFSVRELIQRIRAMLRRGSWYQETPRHGNVLEFGGNRVDFRAYKARTSDSEVILTQKECMLLKLLAEGEGRVIGRDEILDRVWGYDRYPSSRTIDNLILRLRKHFEADPKNPKHIHTLYGAGYRFTSAPTPAEPPSR
ncbi:response regulator transcription factor [bacterium]|nr:response regulator transcription factor [bacterium]MBU1983345.1 response regulator transcription factor [bacterium]